MVRIGSDCIKVSGASISQLQPCRASIFLQGLVCLLQQRFPEGWPGGEKRGSTGEQTIERQSSRTKHIARGRFSCRLTKMWELKSPRRIGIAQEGGKNGRTNSTVMKFLMEVVCPLILP